MNALRVIQLAIMASIALAKPFESLHNGLDEVWQRVGRAAPDHPIELRISLPIAKQGLVEEHLLEISDPSNPRWRQHLSSEEVQSILQPDDGSVSAVTHWLASFGIASTHSYHTVIARTTVEVAEKLLNTTYSIFGNAAGGRVLRTREYYVPLELQEHVRMVAPTIQFPHGDPQLRAKRRNLHGPVGGNKLMRKATSLDFNSSLEAACGPPSNYSAGPDCVAALYSIDWTVSNSNTSFSIYDTGTSGILASDFNTYLQGFNKSASDITVDYLRAPGWNVTFNPDGSPDEETTIDFQVSSGLTLPTIATVILSDSTGVFGNIGSMNSEAQDAEGQDYFLQFLHQMVYNETVPPVVSISAGANEDYVPEAYAREACSLIAASGARGVTWIASSGDTGPLNPRANHKTPVDPQWPASCPWILAVGATANPYDEVGAVTPTFFTGGGFSNYFPRPSYQDNVVPNYINSSVTPAFAAQPGFNASGRGYPDVAAIGVNIPIVFKGQWGEIFGTSASAPIWAGIITLLNDYEASRGHPTLGFVNSWLYSLEPEKGLHDIVVCNGSHLPAAPANPPFATTGYNGSVGWDACTGLGTPMFDVLRAALP